MGIFEFFGRSGFFGKIKSIFSGPNECLDGNFARLEELLVGNDVGVDTTDKIINNLKKKINRDNVSQISTFLVDEINAIMYSFVEKTTHVDGLYVILMVGVNGVGKTTTIAKLANKYKVEGKKVLVGACDTFRAAAVEQLQNWCNSINVDVVSGGEKDQPSSVVFKTIDEAQKNKADIVIIDTAGRLQSKSNLMAELEKMYKVILKFVKKENVDVFLVLDGSTGQNVFSQVSHFSEVADVSGIVITKMDGVGKSGFIIGIYDKYKIPVKYVCVGEKIGDILPFNTRDFVNALVEK